jgi:hypothetical protein
MALSVFEMIGTITLQGAEAVKNQLSGLEGYVKNNAAAFKTAGIAVSAFGAAVTGALAYAVKAAVEEKEGIARLSVALGNVGVNYDSVKSSIEGVITAQAKKTNYSDNEQMDALQQLVLITGKYDLSLKALPTVLDLAAAKQMDASSAAVLMAKAMNGNTEALKRYGIEVPKDASALEILEAILAKVKGTAEATSNPFTILKNQMGSFAATIGSSVLPIISALVNKVVTVVAWVKEWADAHPALAREITVFMGTLGLLALAIGPILIFIPQIITQLGLLRIAFIGTEAAAGPVGWAIAGISLALTGLAVALPFITGKTNDLTKAIAGLGSELDNTALQSIKTQLDAIKWSGEEVGEILSLAAEHYGISVEALVGRLHDLGNAQVGVADASKLSTDEMIANLKTLSAEAKRRAGEITDAQKSAIDDRMEASRKAHDQAMQQLDDEYNSTIKLIDAQLGYTLSGYDAQIKAIDKQIDDIRDAKTTQQDRERKASLEKAVADAKNDSDRAEAGKELTDFLAELAEEQTLKDLEDKKDALREKEDMAREEAQNLEDRAREQYEYQRRLADQAYDDLTHKLWLEKDILDKALKEQLKRYDDDLKAFDEAIDLKLLSAEDFVKKYNEALDQITKTVVVTIVEQTTRVGGGTLGGGISYGAGGAGAGFSTPYGSYSPGQYGTTGAWSAAYGQYQHGGPIIEDTLLVGLRSMRPYAQAEKGEYVIPPGGGGVVINIAEVHIKDEADMDHFLQRMINEIRLRTGIRR